MNSTSDFHVVPVGWGRSLLDELWRPIESRSADRFSYVMHPREVRQDFADPTAQLHFFQDEPRRELPEADRGLLAALERPGVPTVHNMILGDRVVSRLAYDDALRYATFIARRLAELFEELKPSVIIGGWDGVHGGLTLGVARRMGIPWFAMNFSVIPTGLMCFSNELTAVARVQIAPRDPFELRPMAEDLLGKFERRTVQAPAYVTPTYPSLGNLGRIPARLAVATRTVRNRRASEFLRFTDERTSYSMRAAVGQVRRLTAAAKALASTPTLRAVPETPYVLFGLHLQPESSIDIWAPFFSNQPWVLETLSRSIPPSHKLLVKIHKSDAANYSREQLDRMRALPGLELVHPHADTRRLIENAALIVSIQGTMGLEGGLLGKPVIMLGESPARIFPSVSQVGALIDLPALVQRKLTEPPPQRSDIVKAYAAYLNPLAQVVDNDWTVRKTAADFDRFAEVFRKLKEYVLGQGLLKHGT
jgi:hypothetical protein